MTEKESPIRIRTKLEIFRGLPDFSPFISVFFLLLIFFMIGTSFVQVSGIHVDLPQISGGSSFGAQKFVVTLDAKGKIYFNDILLSGENAASDLKTHLANCKGPNASERTTILLRPDASANFSELAKILAVAEETGVNVFLLTTPPAPSVRVRSETE